MDFQSDEEKCQLSSVCSAGKKLNGWDFFIHFIFLRAPMAFKRRLEKWKRIFGLIPKDSNFNQNRQTMGSTNTITADIVSDRAQMQREGYLVRIKSMEEIKKTLDAKGYCKGLLFMPGQAKFCGQMFEVLKEVDRIYDEREMKMKKIHDVIVLKNNICDGSDVYDKEGCGRCCFYFWKKDWFEKI